MHVVPHEEVARNGFIHLRGVSLEETLALARSLGPIQGHPKAPQGVRTRERTDEAELLFHSDGSYLNRVIRRGAEYFRVVPPQWVIIRMEQSADGGLNTILHLKDRSFIRQHCPDQNVWEFLTSSGRAVSSYGDGEWQADSPIISSMLRFNPARLLVKASDFEHMNWFERFLRSQAPKTVEMARGDVLIVDNWHSLHGVTAFTGTRLTQVIWVAAEPQPLLPTLGVPKISESQHPFAALY